MLKIENLLIMIFGMVSVAVFILMIFKGGLFESANIFWFREVSFLVSPYSHATNVTTPLYQIYNYALIFFAFVLSFRMHSNFAKLGSLYLMISAMIGLMLVQFPMDPRGISGSQQGITHIATVLFMAFHVSVALLLLAAAFKRISHLRWLSRYSVLTCILLVVASFFTGVFALRSMPEYVGLLQKMPIIVFLSWILITSVGMLYSDKRIKYYVWH